MEVHVKLDVFVFDVGIEPVVVASVSKYDLARQSDDDFLKETLVLLLQLFGLFSLQIEDVVLLDWVF